MSNSPAPTSPPGHLQPVKIFFLTVLTFAVAALVLGHVDGINGPSYWQWPWRMRRGFAPYLLLLLTALPLLVAEMRFTPAKGRAAGIVLMMMTVLAFEISNRAMDLQAFDLTRVATIIEEPGSIGYFTHAREMIARGQSVHDFLRDYQRLMPGFTLHARNKPPGSILFYVPFLRLAADENSAALAAGLCIALLATLSVPATYLLTVELTGDRAAAYQAAACMALCPGLVLFLPEFDQFYPVYSCGLIILWAKALRTGETRFAVAFGLLFAFVCFQTFNLAVLGVFLAGYALFFSSPRIFARQSLAAIVTIVAVYGLFWLWSGYNPIGTLGTGIALHQQDMPATHRTWPATVPFDLTDFALGMGWVCVLLAVYYLLDSARSQQRLPLVILCFAEPVAIALSGLLAGETARVWIFVFPLLLIPAGLELAAWPGKARLWAFACLWLLAAVLSQNMVFV